MATPPRIAVVIGSTRPTRITAGIATWARDTLHAGSDLEYELLDLADIDLPLLDEPLKAALHTYQHAHTNNWSRQVSQYDGFVFVFPQYNWGYPAVLKNALDYLYTEWRDKPASTFTFGTRGGNKGAAQLTEVLHGLHMRVTHTRVEAVVTDDDVDADWQLTDIPTTLQPTLAALRAIDDELIDLLLDNGTKPTP